MEVYVARRKYKKGKAKNQMKMKNKNGREYCQKGSKKKKRLKMRYK